MRERPPQHLLFASTSSIYGGNQKSPFSEVDRADGPVSLYAATKKSCEAMIHSYSHLWRIPSTCIRFFTVYGPWSRPDMAMLKFAYLIKNGQPIDVYGEGKMRRDFTFVDDLVDSIVALKDHAPQQGRPAEGVEDSLSAVAPFRIVNAGGGKPTQLMDFIETLERAMGTKAKLNMLPMQPGDVVSTESDVRLLKALIGKIPQTPLEQGIGEFARWFKSYTA
jgi:UDP-glucuronate 4-epimerase